MTSGAISDHQSELEIAIVGMAGRFPKAQNLEQFWQNLRNGVECTTSLSDAELKSSGVNPALFSNPKYVRTRAVLDGIQYFDAPFFGINAREAEIMDPQHRLFMECAWEALENAGYDPEGYKGLIGVYAGSSMSSYLFNLDLVNHRTASEFYQISLGNRNDFLPTRISYKLNLKGPSVNIQTACSTSLVAVHVACQALLSGECDMALAGAVSIQVPQRVGYLYEEGMIRSPDGRCRAFDANAHGTAFGGGLGIVVLKRLADAEAAGDRIDAVIKGSAINNDGALKVGYTAPSVEGQANVIRAAQTIAEVDPETLSYIETHGTGTELGDPIEIAALTKAFRARTQKTNFCAIGSLKTNIGHTDTVAGVAGLIKTVLALKHKQIPPSLNFEEPNPAIDFANSPFYVNTKLCEWRRNGGPRRAGVSSFGIGGTNAHVIVEEAPEAEEAGKSRPWQLLLLSARTDTALDTMTANLAKYLRRNSDVNLSDLAHTLQVGRKTFGQRRIVVCRDVDDAVNALETPDPQRVFSAAQNRHDRPVAFMFTGQGSQYVGMAQELWAKESIFRENIDTCSELLKPHLGLDLRDVLYPSEGQAETARQKLNQTYITQPALFVIEYALAKLWTEWGVKPGAMIGHSIGEYVAACLAGVFSLKEALELVAARGRLMQSMPTGAMLSVVLPEDGLSLLLGTQLSLAAVNGPGMCVVAGPTENVDSLERQLTGHGVACQRLSTSHAFHSEMMEPILEPFTRLFEKINLQPPAIPYVSNVTGTWITEAEATEPKYWARHLRETVCFGDGVRELLKDQNLVLLEVGPGQTLVTLARRNMEGTNQRVALPSLCQSMEQQSDIAFILGTLGRLWLAGVPVAWSGFYIRERRSRVGLPTYPFEHQPYWIEPRKESIHGVTRAASLDKKPDIADWFYIPSWKRSLPLPTVQQDGLADQKMCWLVFMDECDLGTQIAKRLKQQGQSVISVKAGKKFKRIGEDACIINPHSQDDYNVLIKELRRNNKTPYRIAHLWSVTHNDLGSEEIESFERNLYLGFYSLLFLVQALEQYHVTDRIRIDIISNQLQDVNGTELVRPEKATILGPCKVVSQEYRNMTCRSIDIEIPPSNKIEDRLVDQLTMELSSKPAELVVAYRGKHRWLQTFEPVRLEARTDAPPRLREGGVYLITDGLEDIGFALAEYLVETVKAKLVFVRRSSVPARDEWEQYLHSGDDRHGAGDKIRKIQALERAGAEVLIVSADVADEKQMASVIAQATQRFGAIHAVIHAAGVVASKSTFLVHEVAPKECLAHFRAKAHEVYVLEKLLRGRRLDFCLLISSLSSVLGGLGLSAHAAANLFMDAFAYNCNQTSDTPWISVNYDDWNFAERTEETSDFGAGLAKLALTSVEGVDAFKRVLSLDTATQVIVSAGDLQARIDRWIKSASSHDTEFARAEQSVASSSLQSRPNLSSAYVAPRNETERILASIWRKLLGLEQVGIYDNFLEMGGDSLLGVRLFAEIEKAFKKRPPLSGLFQEPTIEHLAALITQENPTITPSSLVAIEPRGSKRPFFCVHTFFGDIFCYVNLARHLGADQPFYAIEAQGLNGAEEPFDNIKTMAAHYIKQIRAVQPEGPYALGGLCFAGTVAFEMAQQLRAKGERVAMVALLDSRCSDGKTTSRWNFLRDLILDIPAWLMGSLELNRSQWADLIELKRRMARARKVVFSESDINPQNQAEKLIREMGDFFHFSEQHYKIAYSHYRALWDYKPQVYPGRLTLFKARMQPLFSSHKPDKGWKAVAAGGLEVRVVSGNQLAMLKEPHVQILAKQLKTCLDRVTY